MKEVVMTNVREKLANARKHCPGMSRDFYILTKYMSKITNDQLVPIGMVIFSGIVLNDLETGHSFFSGEELPKELSQRRNSVKGEIQWIPQLVDAIADKEFAMEFRMQWKQIFGTVAAKRVNVKTVKTDTEYPDYVNAAIDWWANAIMSPKFDDGTVLPSVLTFTMSRITREYTLAEIKTFKEALAREIMDVMSKSVYCLLSVKYTPNKVLASAGNLIGIDSMIGYPCLTDMFVTNKEVSVRAGYGAPRDVIWRA